MGLAHSIRPFSNSTGSYASTSGSQFTIDGKTGYFPGTNCYWCSFLKKHADIDLTLDRIADSGLRILRVWGFSDVLERPSDGKPWFQHLSAEGSTINTGPDGLQILDYMVEAAEKRGLKLVIPFVNYWSDYGGMKAYLSAFGRKDYRKYIKTIVNRYHDSKAIFAWELANEPRCPGCNTDVIYQWAANVSGYVKDLDRNHMVTLGDEGMGLNGTDNSYPYTYAEGTDFAKLLTIDTLDFGTIHIYPSHWNVEFDWGNDWIESHAKACMEAGKPCFLEEYGAESPRCSIEAPWQKTMLKADGMGADAFWQWGDVLSGVQTPHDEFSIYYKTADWECLVRDHVRAINASS
ncbi:Mannan endo-1,4-beta-mannosidase A [Fusarium oxysporum f. sp. cubense race 1]|uniref:Mannan endo-1,4-beta-mannosidase A n=1 Tax=Fusarium oxysporum f. sp. cubense (strain race 1) TaxID=1229664 RepID=N4V099_FUSC1|nr:Mannan endo-1,4-beta-mannosidase A [Fusarium oxysporum f. sp. cubense race 1]